MAADAGGIHPNGIRVPRWLVTVVVTATALLGAGYAVGQRVRTETSRIETIEVRLCRIETALHIDPWPGCPRARP